MKTIKIILVALFVLLLGGALYLILTPDQDDVPDSDIVIPDGCDLDWIQQYIDSSYRAVPIADFAKLKTRREEMQGSFDNIMHDSPVQCKQTVDLMLRNRFQSRFIQMARNEFNDAHWPHYSIIRDINGQLLKELNQGSPELKDIEAICKEYGSVLTYNNNVKKQSQQSPSSFNSQWDFNNTRDLISNTPTAKKPVNHTAQYDSSRPDNVKDDLYKGHVSFLYALTPKASGAIQNEPTRLNYNRVCDVVSKEIERFETQAPSLYGKSGVREKARELYKILDDLEKYVNDNETP